MAGEESQIHNRSSGGLMYRPADSQRKRQRAMGQRSALMLALALCVSTTSAFLSPAARLATTVRKPFSCRVTLRNDGSPASHPGEDEGDDDQSSGWLSWMAQGRRKGVSEVKMRDPEELGGVPRSDRYSSSDWLHNTASLPSSAILRAIRGPVIFMTSWATFLSVLYIRLKKVNPIAAESMCLPQAPHSLMVSALSLLLVFKTNSAYQRFAEGRKIWEIIINNSRDLYRMLNLYENEMGRSKRRRLQRLLAAFPYLLRHRIRPNLVMYRLDDVDNVRDPENSIVLYQDRAADDLDPEAAAVATKEENEGNSRRKTRPLYWVDKRTLPWRLLPPNALESCARAQNRPLWVCDRMAQELRNIPDSPFFTARERLAFISKVERLSGCIGACERIHQTAVPLNYARHSLRALTLWLFTLPFSLVGSLKLVTGPVLFLVSWLLFGVYEIGYSIEDPFQGTLRLSVLCDTIRRDVLADEVIRSTAFRTGEEPDDYSTTSSSSTVVQQPPTVRARERSADYASSSVTRHEEVSSLPIDGAIEYDEEDRDYESSPLVKKSFKEDEDEFKAPPLEVEELPEIPIMRSLNTSQILSDKRP